MTSDKITPFGEPDRSNRLPEKSVVKSTDACIVLVIIQSYKIVFCENFNLVELFYIFALTLKHLPWNSTPKYCIGTHID